MRNNSNDKEEDEENWGRKSNISLLDQHTELKKMAEGKGHNNATQATLVLIDYKSDMFEYRQSIFFFIYNYYVYIFFFQLKKKVPWKDS